VFQLESPLGRQWTKKLKPESYEHIGALGPLLRPGCLKAVDEDGVSR
jgi:DNA polymerase III alpha subunit